MSLIHRSSVVVCLVAAAACSTQASYITSESPALIAVESDTGNLYTVNTTDASLSLLGNVGTDRIGGLEFYEDTLYGMRADYNGAGLFAIDQDTLAGELVGSLGEGFFYEGALAVAADGTAYAAQRGFSGAPELLSIDLATGHAATIAVMNNGPHDINGLALLDDDTLIGLDRVTNAIVTISTDSADVQVLLPMPEQQIVVGGVGGMAVDAEGIVWFVTAGPQNIYAGSNTLYSFNPGTNAVTPVGLLNVEGTPITGSGISGLAYIVPEPGMALLLSAAIGGLIMHRRRTD